MANQFRYSMASDGLLFAIFGRVSSRSRTPVYSTLIGGLLAAVMALVFDLLTLVEMLSIGTLIAYTQVSLAVLISRYEMHDDPSSDLTKHLASVVMIIITLCLISIHSFERHEQINFSLAVLFALLLGLLILLIHQNFSRRKFNLADEQSTDVFLTPFVPWLPIFSIFCNVYLMLKLSVITWIRFAVWMAVGFVIYFSYGIRHAGKILCPISLFI